MKIVLLVGVAILVFVWFFNFFRDVNFPKASAIIASTVSVVLCVGFSYLTALYQSPVAQAQEKGYTQVEKYIAEEGNTVTTHTESNIYTKDGKLYKAKNKKGLNSL